MWGIYVRVLFYGVDLSFTSSILCNYLAVEEKLDCFRHFVSVCCCHSYVLLHRGAVGWSWCVIVAFPGNTHLF